MIVVDTNILVAFFLKTPSTELAHQLHRRDPDWAVPQLWQHEFLNVLAMHEQRKVLSFDECASLWTDAREAVEPLEHDVNMIEALHFAAAGRISAYDAQYVALAHRLATVCVTMDKELLRRFPDLTASPLIYVEPFGHSGTVRERHATYRAQGRK